MTHDFFAHNWVDEFVEAHSWRTQITAGETTLSEQRFQLAERPYRSFRVHWTGCDRQEAQAMRYQLMRGAQDTWQIPLYPDVWVLPSAIVASATAITGVDNSTRRFYAGNELLIVDKVTGEQQTRTVTSIGGTSSAATLNLSGALNAVNAGSYVYPLLTVQPLVRSPEITWVTSDIVDVSLEVAEVVGDNEGALPSWDNTGLPSASGGFQDKPGVPGAGTPIYPVSNLAGGAHWGSGLRNEIARIGEISPLGRGVTTDLRGDRALETFGHPMLTCGSRAEVFQILGWHDNRKGKTRAFWLPAPFAAFETLTVGASSVVVKAWGGSDTLANFNDFVEFVALVGENNDTVMAEVSSAVLSAPGEWTISFTSAVVLPSPVVYVTTGHFVRFSTDTLEIRWITASGTAELGPFSMVEVREDNPVSLSTYP